MNQRLIKTGDGINIHLTEFESNNKNCTIIINCATAVPQQFYYLYAKFLATNGYRCICWDYRGIGKSSGEKEKTKNYSLNHWGNQDLSAILKYANTSCPDHKIIVFGHSIGGVILGFTKSHHLIDGLIFYAVQSAYFLDWKFPYSIKLFVEWHIFLPLITWFYGYFPGTKFGLGTDIPGGYIKHWKQRMMHPDLKRLFKKMGKGELYFEKLNCKLVHFNMTDDHIATPKAVNRVNKLFTNADIESIWVNPENYGETKIGHFDFFKKRKNMKLWDESLKWLKKINI